MANPAHVAKLKEGAKAWNKWRQATGEKPDLSGLQLIGDSLGGYNLATADLSGAFLQRVDLSFTQCAEASFDRAFILESMFRSTELNKTTFRRATVRFTVFVQCGLDEADFTEAALISCSFSRVSLGASKGLTSTNQFFLNSIGIDTFFQSGGLPESFLRGAGVPEEFIQYASSLVGKAIEFYSCFLSYSSKDDEFARRLYNDLQGKNIRTWFAPEELKIGDRFRSRIDESIRIHDKLVLILSANSVASDWVETEVESALERERKEGKEVLFPIAIDDEGFTSQQSWAADIRRKRHIGDFRTWKSHDDYTNAFDRLVRDLKKSQPPIIMKGG
ncbi:MAG: hypothetical protein QOC81_3600 [Thermoanaerobaculia bacterium]|jgi:uncharacterized protein YjbI with pentapeptide repeats|nr:hypothetical protein [Thermoanaerobaculia bacterium]